MGTAGASEAKELDLQAAIESTFQVVLSALSGATLVHDVGFLDCAAIGSLEMLVLTDEIIGMARRVMRGIEVNDTTLMLNLIDRVGPGVQESGYVIGERCPALEFIVAVGILEDTQIQILDRLHADVFNLQIDDDEIAGEIV